VGCKLCVTFCPFGGAGIDIEGKVIKCNLCKGDPQCVKNCEPKALQFIEATSINLRKRRLAAENLSELMKTVLTAT
ncbi:MAG: 4Fe-4S dicluster domain-containing protein, partial [Candidatus Hodarchaeota archaeon]